MGSTTHLQWVMDSNGSKFSCGWLAFKGTASIYTYEQHRDSPHELRKEKTRKFASLMFGVDFRD